MHPFAPHGDGFSGWRGRFFALGLMLVFESMGCKYKPPTQKPPVAITLAYPTNISPALVFIGVEKGLFTGRGARITSAVSETGKAALDRMLAGEADIAVAAETPIARAILNNAKFKILATIQQSGLDTCVVARKDKGIKAPADLRGKVIGYSKGTSGHYFLDSFLLANRIGLHEVQLVDLSPLQLRAALLEGRVDAVATWDPHTTYLMEALGARGAMFTDEFIYIQTFCVVARPEFIQDHPEQVKAILEGLVAALELMARSPKETQAIIAAYARVDPLLVSKSMPNHHFDVRLDQSLLVSLGDECKWFREFGAIPPQDLPDLLSYLHLPGLEEVRPEAVQVIRYEAGGRP